jgi:hypothetical protein
MFLVLSVDGAKNHGAMALAIVVPSLSSRNKIPLGVCWAMLPCLRGREIRR